MSENKVLRRSMMLGGRELTFETGRLAKQASGAVLATYGETTVLAAATASNEPREGIDFFPLTVDFEEKMYAVGRIPGSFHKREGRPGEKAILSSRLIDRPTRPLFPKGYRNDVHIVPTVLSVDYDNEQDVLAMNAVAAALHISHIPYLGPTGSVNVGLVDGELVINPTLEQREKSDLHLIVAGTADAVMMVEAGANEISEERVLDAIMFGHEEIKRIVDFTEKFREEALAMGLASEKEEPVLFETDKNLEETVTAFAYDKMLEAVKIKDKHQRDNAISAVKDEASGHFADIYPDDAKTIRGVLDAMLKKIVRKLITVDKIRPDGRALDEIRPISCEAGVLPKVHGSGLFTRGQTQVMSVLTLGSLRDKQIIDDLTSRNYKRYIHHYNFPPYSVGEARFMRGPGRREIGHGALAERALLPVVPDEEEFPYAIRIVSEAIESNGSTSMASVCGSTISLMQAGVPIKAPVSGIAMGLVKQDEHFSILTDIQGMEDAMGDMDFKVAGTAEGVTAIQMDIKIDGLSREILEEALQQAHKGRMFILKKITDVIAEPAPELSPTAPRIITLTIDKDKIKDVIGPGGKMIKKIVEDTGVQIDIEDDGTIFIMSVDLAGSEKAVKTINNIVKEPEVGEIYEGKVVRIMNFGAFVELMPGKDGLVHISKISEKRVNKVEDVLNIGDVVRVKVAEIDKQGRVNLTMKNIDKDSEK